MSDLRSDPQRKTCDRELRYADKRHSQVQHTAAHGLLLAFHRRKYSYLWYEVQWLSKVDEVFDFSKWVVKRVDSHPFPAVIASSFRSLRHETTVQWSVPRDGKQWRSCKTITAKHSCSLFQIRSCASGSRVGWCSCWGLRKLNSPSEINSSSKTHSTKNFAGVPPENSAVSTHFLIHFTSSPHVLKPRVR